MAELKPNHICKNPNCTKNPDGGRKHYYACPSCDHSQNWRSVACSWECFIEYQDAVIAARSKGKTISTLPERTDMTEMEIKELMESSSGDIIMKTKKELQDYVDTDGTINISEAVEEVNQKIDNNNIRVKKDLKRKSHG